jgi:hypothetical protein
MENIALISCVSKKCLYKTEAKNMYTSPLFVKSLKYANDILKPNKIFILSAKYGLLNINEKIEPYNETLNDKKQKEKRKWANDVMNQLMKECDLNNDRFIFLERKNYYEKLILSLPNNEILMENLQIGKKLQWLKEKKKKK